MGSTPGTLSEIEIEESHVLQTKLLRFLAGWVASNSWYPLRSMPRENRFQLLWGLGSFRWVRLFLGVRRFSQERSMGVSFSDSFAFEAGSGSAIWSRQLESVVGKGRVWLVSRIIVGS